MAPVDPDLGLLLKSPLLPLGAGLALLLFGRRLYFLLLVVGGFGLGYYLTHLLGIDSEPTTQWIVAAIFGIALGLLVRVLHKTVLAVVGFLLGALAAIWVLELWLQTAGPIGWAAVLLCGLLAAIVMPTLFEAGLVVLSSVVGARLLVEGLRDVGMQGSWAPWAFLALALIGLMVQWRSGRGDDDGRRRRRRDD